MTNRLLRVSSLFFLFVFVASPGFSAASNDAHLTGTLTDPSSAAVGDVHITAVPAGTPPGATLAATSTSDGHYDLALPAGSYHLRFAREPFVTHEYALTFSPGETRTLDLRLELERLSSFVTVTAQAEPIPSSNSPFPVTVISRSQIAQSQAVGLPDLLAAQPGVALARTGAEGGLATIFIDGGDSRYTKILIDGTPLNEPGGHFNLSNFTLDNVDKVEIVHGAESALYGSDAVSGVVQVITHRGSTRVPAVDLFAEGGSFSSRRGGAQLSGLSGPLDYSAATSYFQTDGQGPNDAFLNRAVSANAGWRFSDSNQLRLIVRNQSSGAGIPGPTLLQPANLNQSDSLHLFAANAAWDFRTGNHWQHHLSGTESRTLDINNDQPFFTSIDAFNRAGLQAQSTYFFRAGALSAGYFYEVQNGFPSLLPGEHARRNNQAGFLDGRLQPLPRLTLSAGVRAEANASFGTRVVPRAGAAFALRYGHAFWGDTRLRASYGQGIKEPGMEQSFGSDPCFPGNPNLRPERSRTVFAGVEQLFASDRVRVSVGYFNNRYEDMISFAFGPAAVPGCDFGTGTYFNTDLARARGVNFSAELKPVRWLSIAGSYSYDDTRVLQAPNAFFEVELPGNRLLRRPVHSGNIVANAAFRRLNFNLTGYFSGVRADSDFSGLGLLVPNPGYARFDIAAGYDLGRGISFYGRVANLFDKHYQDAVGFPALGRDFRLGMRFRFPGRQ